MAVQIRFLTFLFIASFLLLPAWAVASGITSVGEHDNELASFEGQSTLRDALNRLLAMTDEQVYFLEPVELARVTWLHTGRPNLLLYDLLKKYSYVSTKMTDQDSPRIVVYSSPRSVPADPVTAGSDAGRAFAQSESQSATELGAGQSSEAPVRRTGQSTSLSYASPGTIQRMTLSGSSADNLTDFSTDSSDRKQQLEVKIKQLEKYIVSGHAKKNYLYWTEIKDPKYVYDPWAELEILQERYSKL